MRPSLFLLGASAGLTLAQIPPNLDFADFTKYLPFCSNSLSYMLNSSVNPTTYANADGLTVFLTLDFPFFEFLAKGLPGGVIGQIETKNLANIELLDGLFSLFQVPGQYPSASINGTEFLTTRFTDPKYNFVTGGAKLLVHRDATSFYIKTGLNLISDVVIPDLKYNGGIIHVLNQQASPLYSVNDTGYVLNIPFLTALADAHPEIETTSDLTIFAPTGHPVGPGQVDKYVIQGKVLYSTEIVGSKTYKTLGGTTITVSKDGAGNIRVNGVKVAEADILVQNGVVHTIGGPMYT
ncbi:hypothetical protein MMC09_005256 [Bachmanniomyces sp. S44760]|nr:hypothetical protein [Bachmanniomyces sp. S44760]